MIQQKVFCNILSKMGENITIQYELEDGAVEEIQTKASLVTATDAAYNLTDREFLFKGDVIVPLDVTRELSGMKFIRELYPNKKYIFLSLIEQQHAYSVSKMFAVQTNSKITICKSEERIDPETEDSNNVFVPYAIDLDAYFTTVVRTQKYMQDGSLDQSIYACIVPSKYKVSPNMRIIRRVFIDGEISEQAYKVESVDFALTELDNSAVSGFTGILNMQLSEDIRSEKTVYEEETP